MRQLNILHLCSARKYVGEAARVVELAATQLELGHNAIVAGRSKLSVIDACERHRIPCIGLNMGSRFNPWKDYKDVLTIRRTIHERDIDILHVHRGKDHWLASWARSAIKKPLPIIRSRHVITPVKGHIANRWLFQHGTDAIDCVSFAVRDALQMSLPWLKLPIKVIQGGMRPERLRNLRPEENQHYRRHLHISDDNFVITLLGRIDAVKGHIHLIRAIPAIVDSHPEAVILFAYPRQSTYRARLEDEIKKLEIADHIRWLGEQDSIIPILETTDLGVIASIGSEGWSRVAVEFMRSGIPVVASSVGSLPEIVRHNETGFLVPPENPSALADAILSLLDSAQKREQMSEASREAGAYFSHTRVAEETDQFYREILTSKGIQV